MSPPCPANSSNQDTQPHNGVSSLNWTDMNESMSPPQDSTVPPDRDTSKLHRQCATEASTVSAAHSHQVMPNNTAHDQVSQLCLQTGHANQTDFVAQNLAFAFPLGQSCNMIIQGNSSSQSTANACTLPQPSVTTSLTINSNIQSASTILQNGAVQTEQMTLNLMSKMMDQMTNITDKLQQMSVWHKGVPDQLAWQDGCDTVSSTVQGALFAVGAQPAHTATNVFQPALPSTIPGLRNDVDSLTDFKSLIPVVGMGDSTIKASLYSEFAYLNQFVLNMTISHEGLGELQQVVDNDGQVSYKSRRPNSRYLTFTTG